MSKIEESIYLSAIAAKALKVPENGFLIEEQPLDKNLLFQEDTLIPVFVSLSNILGEILLHNTNENYDSVYPLNLEKTKESLCFVKVVENNSKNSVPNSLKVLLTMEVMDSLFIPNQENKIDLTHLVRTWREVLSPIKEGQVINIKDFYESLVIKNLEILSKEYKLKK